jgi:hypothetical protein
MNRNRKAPLLSLVLIVLALGSASEIYACSCVLPRPVCEAFGRSSAVFVGRVVGAAQQKTVKAEDGTKTTYDVGEIYFEVEEAFSGVKSRTRATIRSGTGGGDCGYWFIRGERYLVYANGDEKGNLYTNICSRTRPLVAADEDLPFLRSLPVEGAGVRLYGVVAKLPDASLPRPRLDSPERYGEGVTGITVTVKNARGQQQETVTDSAGRYELTGLKPGEYEVSAALPDYFYKDEYSTHKIRVYDRGCAEENFAAIPDGHIIGRVEDAEGKPIREAKVVLISAKAEGYLTMRDEISSDYIAKDAPGRFKFSQVPPGEYLLALNATSSPDAESPYPPTYYPGVTDRALATVIKVGLGQKLKDYVLRLPPKLAERTVQGFVLWADDTPAVDAEVRLVDHDHPGWTANGTTKTDALGRFSLTGYDGLTYWVMASAAKFPDAPFEEQHPMHAEPPSVMLTNSVSGLKLVLTSEGSLCKHYYQEKPAK